jgi:hypothetical protein
VIEVNGRIAGGGLVLSVDAGQRAVPIDIVPVESALRPEERSARYHHNGAVIWLTGLPGSGQIDAGACAGAPAVLARRLADPAGWRHAARRPQWRSRFLAQDRTENIRRLAEVATHLARNGHIAIVAAVSPSADDRAAARRIADTRSARSMSQRRPRSARAATPRAITPRRAPARCRPSPGSAMITSRRPGGAAHRHLGQDGFGCDRRDRADAGGNRHPVRRIGGSGGQYLKRFRAKWTRFA